MSEYLSLWRIVADTPDYEAHDLSGKGAELTGGRWNRKGSPMIYASMSRALACLETVVQFGGSDTLPLNRYLVEIKIPADLWTARRMLHPAQHVGWDAQPPGKVSMDWGTAWIQATTTVLAQVPSVIVLEEHNILIHPRHPDAKKLKATKIRKWMYDRRIK